MRMLSKKDLISGEVETLRKSRNPTTVVTAGGEVQTNEEARENVHDLDLFVTMQLLEDTPAVMSLGKLCEQHGYTYEWDQWSKATCDPKWEADGNFRACCPGIVVRLWRTFVFYIVTAEIRTTKGHRRKPLARLPRVVRGVHR